MYILTIKTSALCLRVLKRFNGCVRESLNVLHGNFLDESCLKADPGLYTALKSAVTSHKPYVVTYKNMGQRIYFVNSTYRKKNHISRLKAVPGIEGKEINRVEYSIYVVIV